MLTLRHKEYTPEDLLILEEAVQVAEDHVRSRYCNTDYFDGKRVFHDLDNLLGYLQSKAIPEKTEK